VIIDRFELDPARTVFIDDNLRNIQAAEAIGLNCILFESPVQLEKELRRSGILKAS
jgi:2-haloacid dehalogenase